MGDTTDREAALAGLEPTQLPWPVMTPWVHPKTGGLYLVLGVATCSTNGDREDVERSVVYWSFAHRSLRYRELSEFMDGRFEEYDRDAASPA